MKRTSFAVFSLMVSASVLSAQSSVPQLNLASPPPAGPTSVSARATANGLGTYCYWVFAILPAGKTAPSGPACVSQAGGTVVVAWSPVAFATGYDLIRNSTNGLPVSGNIAVSTNINALTFTDTLGALSSYTISTIGSATANVWVDATQAPPLIVQSINGAAPTPLGGGITEVSSLPATCTVTGTPNLVFLTTGTVGPYYCSALNTWTFLGGGSGSVTQAIIAGTSRQLSTAGTCTITTTGTCTLSFPTNLLFPGTPTFTAATTGGASFNVPSGVAPSVPVNGDFWNAAGVLNFYYGATTFTPVLTSANDTNVTGAISAGNLTLGWTGTLAAGRLNSNVVQGINNDTNVTGSIAAQNLTLGWTGTLAAGRLNSNVVQGITNDTNVTGSISAQNLSLGWTGTLAKARIIGTAVYNDQTNTYSTGTQDFRLATHFFPRTGTAAAITGSSCTTGEVGLATDATAGQNWYFCTATNTWTQQLNSGAGGGYATIDSNGSAVTQRATVNFISGTNATVSCVDNAGATRTDCTVSASSSAGSRLDQITAATGTNTIANGNFPQVWNWAQTSNTQYGFKFGETSAATGGTGVAQGEVGIVTAAGSTAVPLTVNNSLTGSQNIPALLINPTWNTSAVVDAALLVNPTNTASGTGSLLIDAQLGGTSQWKVDKAGNTTQLGSLSTGPSAPTPPSGGTGGAMALGEGTTPSANCAVASVDCLWADSTQHGFLARFNNGSALPLVQGPTTSNVGNLATQNSTTGGLLADAGFLATNVVRKDAANTYAAGSTLNDFSLSNIKLPSGGSFVSTSSNTIGINSTFNNVKVWNGSVDGLAALFTSLPANGNLVSAVNSTSNITVTDSGVVAANVTTAASNFTSGNLVQAAGNNKTESDSGIPTANVVTAAANYTSGNLVQAAASNKTTSDSGVAVANVVTAASAAAAAGQVCTASGASKSCSYIDFPDSKSIPLAICVNGTAATGVTTTTSVGGTCRAGTNNKDAFLGPFTTSDTVVFKVHLPKDWRTATAPALSVDFASTDTVNTHTVILQAATRCSALDGSTTDDTAYNTAQSLSTVTLNSTSNQTWTATLASLTTTGCTAPGILWVKITRTTDTATNVELYEADITIPRALVMQAN